jgi:DNA-binding LacI/PurR family transcriptional regulator
VPEDISLVGYDDIALSAYTQPGLSTLRLSRQEIATVAFRALFHARRAAGAPLIEGEDHIIRPTFVERQSTGPASQ